MAKTRQKGSGNIFISSETFILMQFFGKMQYKYFMQQLDILQTYMANSVLQIRETKEP